MVKGKTKTGFEFEVDERIKNDWRVVHAIADIQSKDESIIVPAMVKLIKLIINNQEEALMEHIANNNEGFVPTNALYAEISDILTQIPAIKN
ncbi:MAG: hypothetical protein MJZ37_07935 [Bacilli bacterium]|nr:hypothetical protein [Bacilli bacterium]